MGDASEAALPQAALASDLILQASAAQSNVDPWHEAGLYTNPYCQVVSGAPILSKDTPPPSRPDRRNAIAVYAAILLAALGTAGRRALRPALRLAKTGR